MATEHGAGRTAAAAAELAALWASDPRWKGVTREYDAETVTRLRPAIMTDQAIARNGAERLWKMIHEEPIVRTFGALTGAQAVQMVKGGLQAIYLSGWQVAADGNQAGQTFPDQSLYPSNSVPMLVKRLNSALMRADQINHLDGDDSTNFFVPIVADAEAGFGGSIHAFELMKQMIEAGAAAVHYEDQLASEKKCGHMGGKVLVPTAQHIRTLQAARLAADVMGVPTLVVARTDAQSATLLTSDIDDRDKPFITGERTPEGFFLVKNGTKAAIARGLAYSPYADMLWCETDTPDLNQAKEFADAIHAEYPDMVLAYNCSPSFNWKGHLDDHTIEIFQDEIAKMGYRFQFITLAGWHSINYQTFNLAKDYAVRGMPAYVNEVQEAEFAAESEGYTATRHQREAGAGYFDEIALAVAGGESSTTALAGSTESAQFTAPAAH